MCKFGPFFGEPMPKAAARLPDSKKRKSQTRQSDVCRDQKQKRGRL